MFPEAQVQTCIVHMVRAGLNYAGWKERRRVAADLKAIYRAATEQQAEQELTDFIAKWGTESALKLLYSALRNVIAKWDTIQHWREAMNHFQTLWGARIKTALNR